MKASVEPSPNKPLRRKSKSMEELAGATQVAEEERRRPSRRRSAGPSAIGGITNSMSHSLIIDRSSRGIAGTEGGVNISFIDKKGLGAAAIGDILSDFSYEDDDREEKENDENDDYEEQDEVKSITEECLLDASEVTNDTNDEKKDNECCSMQSSTRSLNSSLRNVRRDGMRTQRSQRSVTFLLDPGDSEDEEKK